MYAMYVIACEFLIPTLRPPASHHCAELITACVHCCIMQAVVDHQGAPMSAHMIHTSINIMPYEVLTNVLGRVPEQVCLWNTRAPCAVPSHLSDFNECMHILWHTGQAGHCLGCKVAMALLRCGASSSSSSSTQNYLLLRGL